jgi:hypothetical protein
MQDQRGAGPHDRVAGPDPEAVQESYGAAQLTPWVAGIMETKRATLTRSVALCQAFTQDLDRENDVSFAPGWIFAHHPAREID